MVKDSTKSAVKEILDVISSMIEESSKQSEMEIQDSSPLNFALNLNDDNYFFGLCREYITDGLKEEIKGCFQSHLHERTFEFVRISTNIIYIIDTYYSSDFDERKRSNKDIFIEVITLLANEIKDIQLKFWVNVYERTREKGGNEEGGWWYDWDTCIKSVLVPYIELEKTKQQLSEEYGKGEGNISSVLGGYEIHIRTEALKAESQDTERPYYS